MGESEKAEEYTRMSVQISEAIKKNAWDGEWYKRAYFDNGNPLGSKSSGECNIDAIAQSWAVITGAADMKRAAMAMDSLQRYLIDRQNGIIKLLEPPFDCGELEPGYIKGYLPGVRENGGQYTHAAAWTIMAWAKLGEGDKAWECFELINPVNHTRNGKEHSAYKLEPYVMVADVYALSPNAGRGGWSWYTGSAGWMYKTGLEDMLGFQKKGSALIIDPCIPRQWKEYKMRYKYLSTKVYQRFLLMEIRLKGIR
jgi:cellobiose phosphorylase